MHAHGLLQERLASWRPEGRLKGFLEVVRFIFTQYISLWRTTKPPNRPSFGNSRKLLSERINRPKTN